MSMPEFYFLLMSGPPGTVIENAMGTVYFEDNLEKVIARQEELQVWYPNRKFDIVRKAGKC